MKNEENNKKYIYLQIQNLFCEKHLYLGHDLKKDITIRNINK